MKRVPMKLLAVLLFLGIMLGMPKAAEAHNVSGAKNQASYQDHHSRAATANTIQHEQYVVAVGVNQSQEDNCETGCCLMTAACCSPAALAQAEFKFPHFAAAYVFEIGSQVLPQGPPYTLLRPPKYPA